MLLAILLVGAWLRVNALSQIPPGLYHDEAYSGLDALAIARGAGLPIFFEGNGGREPFFIYLHALSISFLGPSSFALRIPAAFVGILTLAAFFVLVRALNASHRHSTGLALIATAGFAVSYWHLNFSRMGWRTISLPLFACLAFYFFWRARRTGKLRDHLLTGALLGAGLYTYLAARFLPFVIALFWLIELLIGSVSHLHLRAVQVLRAKRSNPQVTWRLLWAETAPAMTRQGHWQNAVLTILAAIVVFAPLAIYFLTHPQALFFRVSDVTLAGEGSPLQAIAANAWRVAQMFFASGDPEWRHGIARRPALDWVIGIPFALGLLLALRRWRKPESWFALLWLGIMLLPTILSKDAPDTQRAIGALPAIYLFVAWGLEWLGEFIGARARSHRSEAIEIAATRAQSLPPQAENQSPKGDLVQPLLRLLVARSGMIPALTAFVLIGGGALAFRDYFSVWANDRHAYYDYQGDLADLAAWLNAQPQNIVLPMDLYARSTIHFLTLPRYGQTRSILDLDDAERSQIAAEPARLLSSPSVSDSAFALLRGNQVVLLDPSTRIHSAPSESDWRDRWGKTLASIATVSSLDVTRALSSTPYAADFDQRLSLVGYAMDRNITPGKPYRVTLYWSARARIQEELKLFLHLLDSQGNVIAGVDEPLVNELHTGLLPERQTIPDYHTLPIDAAIAPGKYSLEIGLYQPSNDSRLPIWMNGARVPDDRLIVSLKVAQPPPTRAMAKSLGVQFGDAIVLEGLDPSAVKIKRGDPFRLTLLWKCLQPTDRDYTIFVHLLDAQSRIIAQADYQPQNGNYPSSIWDAGERVLDELSIPIPPDAPAGPFRIAIGVYDANTGQRLPIGQTRQDHVVVDVSGEIVAQ